MSQTMGITEVLQQVREDTDGTEISFGEIVDSLETRGFGPLLMAPALIAILPTGAIPGVPSVCGALIFLLAMQIAAGKRRPWIPRKLENVSFSRDKLTGTVDKISKWTRKVDHLFKPRLTVFSQPGVERAIAFVCGLLGLSLIPLEIIPFAAAIPATAIFLAALGLSTKDGVVTLVSGIIFMATVVVLAVQFL